jgi:thiosulfate/3-mercaptopyruvate sulfurtransferase
MEVHNMRGFAHPDALLSTQELATRSDDPSLAIVEVDEDTAAYDQGHIPGAVTINWSTELRDPIRRDFIGADALAELLGSKGISDEQTIVLYGGNNNWFASYAYWLFSYRGVLRLQLLDGGRVRWERDGLPLTTERPEIASTTYQLGLPRPEIRVTRDTVLDAVAGGGVRFVDVRSPEEYRGEKLAPPHLPQEAAQVPGHIPGAVNVPWSAAANDDGTFKSADELRELYAAAGLQPNGPITSYCRIGERASHTWFALDRLLGYPNVSNYDGSWTEYGSLVDVPVER